VKACGPEVTADCANDTANLAACAITSCASQCTVTAPATCSVDAGALDASDASTDAPGAQDSAVDTGVDAANAGDATTDAIADSSDASPCAACGDAQVCSCGACVTQILFNPVDGGSTNPIFNVNTVATTADGGQPLTTVDGFTQFATASYLQSVGADAAAGLPDNAFFAKACPNIPQVQLSWTNSANILNSTLLSSGSLAFDVPAAQYSVLQLYGISTTGEGSLAATLNYATGSAGSPPAITVNDWCGALPDGGAYALATAARESDLLACHIFAMDLPLDNTRAPTSVTLVYTAITHPGEQTFVLYGANVW
jgi:hypothetical protein